MRASPRLGSDGPVLQLAPVYAPFFPHWGEERRWDERGTGDRVQISTRETARRTFLRQSGNRKQMAHSNEDRVINKGCRGTLRG